MGRRNDWNENGLFAERDGGQTVEGWLRQRRRPSSSRRFAVIYAVLVLIATGLYASNDLTGISQHIVQRAQGLWDPAPAAPAAPASAPLASPPASPPRATAFEPSQAANVTARHGAQPMPQPLNNCIKLGNVIDRDVVACRYGELPRDARPAGQGMVSPATLARYQAERDARAQRARAPKAIDREMQWLPHWNGEGRGYLTGWNSINNRVDSSSVCANHRRGSIDYRECRKGAKAWFRNQCRAQPNDQLRERYCSAANGFNPMG